MSQTALGSKSFRRVSGARRGLLFVKGVPGVGFGDRVQVRDRDGGVRNGQVINSADDLVLVQVFEGTDGIEPESTWVRFLDEPFRIAVSRRLLGRIFDGAGRPRDGRPPVISPVKRNVNGEPVNPAARAYPREFIQTGVSSIDGLNSLVRGQKLPIFSGLRPAAQPARGADRAPGQAARRGVEVRRGVRRHGRVQRRRPLLRGRVRELRRARQRGHVPQPRQRPAHRAPDPAAHRADRRRVPGLRRRHARAGGPHRHDQLCRGPARGGHRQGRRAGAQGLSRLSLFRPRRDLRARRAHQGTSRLHHHGAGAQHAVGRHHPPDPGPHRLHHRGPDRAVARDPQRRASIRR